MSVNDHAQDRYDPPSVGSEWEENFFSELNTKLLQQRLRYEIYKKKVKLLNINHHKN